MKILIIGNGAREHAIAWKVAQSKLVKKIYATGHNAGIEKIANLIPIEPYEIEKITDFVIKEKIDLTIIGPELPLSLGLVDNIKKTGFLVFGPSKDAAILESSKAFCKNFFRQNNILTPNFSCFNDPNLAYGFIEKNFNKDVGIVIKAAGLAGGKGVLICKSKEDAKKAIDNIMIEKIFKDAGNQIVIEEFIKGTELSFMVLTDGENIIPIETARDYKKIYDNDLGPNTGGMGSFSPSNLITNELKNEIITKIIKPILREMNKINRKYTGCLYAGLIYDREKIYVLEINARFGDPETQSVLFRLTSDIVPIMLEIAEGKIKSKELCWDKASSCTVVIASSGYPGAFEKNKPIYGLDSIKEENVFVFHAGTKKESNNIVTTSGRVLSVVAKGNSLEQARNLAYKSIEKIKFENMYYRKDIGL
jgi:phosphoribosylamine--glycine ligase